MIKAINSYELRKNPKKDYRFLFLAFFLLLLYGASLQLVLGWYKADSYVSTLLAFSYLKNGFIRRGLAGTLYDLVCRTIPIAYSYRGAVWFMWGINVLYFISLLAFVKWALDKIEEKEVYKGAYFFALLCFTFMIPTVCVRIGALGRADVLQIVLCLFQIYLLIEMRWEWLTIPLTAVNVMFHEGYVLMTFCAVLIVLLFRAINTEEKRKKYCLLLVLNVIVLLASTLLSLLGRMRAGTAEEYATALNTAASINSEGAVHWNLLSMMADFCPENAPIIDDARFVANGRKELPIFLVCFIPAFCIFLKPMVNLFRQDAGKKRLTHITAVLLGPMLIGVEYIKYCDYGRYIFWLVFYFFVVFLSFATMNDEGAKKALGKSYIYTNVKALFILALMMVYQPLPTCSFTLISRMIRQLVFGA